MKWASRSTLNVALFTVINPLSLNFSRLLESQTLQKGVVSLESLNSRRRLNSWRKSALLNKNTTILYSSILYNELNATQTVISPSACVIKVKTPMDDVTGTLPAVLKMFASLFRIETSESVKKKCSRSYLQQRQRISRHETNLWNLMKHILTSPLICYRTDALQHAIYFSSCRPYK